MWAEIHNKIPPNLAGLEDMLTGNFFGLLQFADPKVLASVLESASFPFDQNREGEKKFGEILDGLHVKMCVTRSPKGVERGRRNKT